MAENSLGTIAVEKKLRRCPVFRIDLKGRFVNVDDLTEKFFGQPSEYYFGKNISEFLDEPSNEALDEILSTGRHFETFFKSVNLTFIDSSEEKHEVGAIISLNFIGGNPANYQLVLTGAFPEPIVEISAASDEPDLIDRAARFIADSNGQIEWSHLAETVAYDPAILYVSFHMYDEGKLRMLGEAYRIGQENALQPGETEDRHVDVASRLQPMMPDPNTENDSYEYVYPLVCRQHTWGIVRFFSENNKQDQFDKLNTIAGVFGKSLYAYVRPHWDQKDRMALLEEAYWAYLNELNCTCFAFEENGNICERSSRFISDDSPLSTVTNIFQLFNPENLIMEKSISDEKIGFATESDKFDLPREGFTIWKDNYRLFKVLTVPEGLGEEVKYIMLLLPGPQAGDSGGSESGLADSLVSAADALTETINKRAVLLSAKSYRQLGSEGRDHLNRIQNECAGFKTFLRRLKKLIQLSGKTISPDIVDLKETIEKASKSISIQNRSKPAFKTGELHQPLADKEIIGEIFGSIFANLQSTGFGPETPAINIESRKLEGRYEYSMNIKFMPDDKLRKRSATLPYQNGLEKNRSAELGIEYRAVENLLKAVNGTIMISPTPEGYTINIGLPAKE